MIKSSSPHYGWVVVGAVTCVLTVTSGARFLYGVVLRPVSEEFGWTRSSLTVAVLISMLVLSLCQPVIGAVADRVGARRIFVSGILLLGVSLVPLSFATSLWQIYVVYGLIVSIALAATSPVNTTALVSRWFTHRRGTALSIATSGSAFGQLLIVPLAAWTLTTTDWETTYRLLAVLLIAFIAPMALLLIREAPDAEQDQVLQPGHPSSIRDRSSGNAADANTATDDRISFSLRGAVNTSSFWLLAYGFFVCGFTMAFANTHFMAFAGDMGMGEMEAADVIAVTAVCSILGSLALGLLADRYSRPLVLGLTYALRGLAFVLLIFFFSGSLIFAYAIVLGVSWTATTPLTAAIAADLYGGANLGAIFGTMFTFMNIGFGVGAFLDGLVYDISGGYDVALVVNAGLGFLAAVAVLRVADRRSLPPTVDPQRPTSEPGRAKEPLSSPAD